MSFILEKYPEEENFIKVPKLDGKGDVVNFTKIPKTLPTFSFSSHPVDGSQGGTFIPPRKPTQLNQYNRTPSSGKSGRRWAFI